MKKKKKKKKNQKQKQKTKDFEHRRGPLLAFFPTSEMHRVGNEHMPHGCMHLKRDYMLTKGFIAEVASPHIQSA